MQQRFTSNRQVSHAIRGMAIAQYIGILQAISVFEFPAPSFHFSLTPALSPHFSFAPDSGLSIQHVKTIIKTKPKVLQNQTIKLQFAAHLHRLVNLIFIFFHSPLFAVPVSTPGVLALVAAIHVPEFMVHSLERAPTHWPASGAPQGGSGISSKLAISPL